MTRDNPRERIKELEKQVFDLENQVKTLVAGELNQYNLQAKLDTQIKNQSALVRMSQKFESRLDPFEIGMRVAETLVEDLDYEKAVICLIERDGDGLTLVGLDGYYRTTEQDEVRGGIITLSGLVGPDWNGHIRVEIGMEKTFMGMDHRVIVPCKTGAGVITGVIIFGNHYQRASVHREIRDTDRTLWKTISRVSGAAFENAILYNELKKERKSLEEAHSSLRKLNEKLEAMVADRTRELAESKDKYRQLYHESERTGELYRTLLDASADPIAVYDIVGFPTYLNPAFTRVFGWELEELKGRKIDFVHPEEKEKTNRLIAKVMRGENFSNQETRRYTKDGSTLDVSISGSTYADENGRTAGSVVHLRDITAQKKMEEELLKVRKLESVGLLAGGIAHDFNNTLSGILMNTQLAQLKNKNGDNVDKYLIGIKDATLKAITLTSQLLTFSKGGLPVMKPMAIDRLIQEWAVFVLRGSQIKCEFDIAPDLLPVEVDEGQMSQVIHNLVINAMQAMPEGGIVLLKARNVLLDREKLETTPTDLQEGRYVHIMVRDRGVGIPNEHMSSIFDPYFTTKQEGSGLGLATTYSIIQKHKGFLTVDSRPSQGSEFHIYLPASDKRVDDIESMEDIHILETGQGRILIMDDQEMLREVSEEMLTALGYEVMTASDGAQTIEMYVTAKNTGRAFDAVIMDLTIPGGQGGKDTVQKLMAIDPDVRAIVSSGYSNNPIMSDYRKYGFRGVLVKPYKIEDVARLLSRILSD